MRIVIGLLVLLSHAISIQADNIYGSITITAKDSRTGLPVKGGLVWLGDSVKDSTANENGKCHFDSVIAGIYSIKIYAAGYDTFIEPSVYIKPINNPEFFEPFVVKFLSPEIDHHVKSAFEPQETITVFSSRK